MGILAIENFRGVHRTLSNVYCFFLRRWATQNTKANYRGFMNLYIKVILEEYFCLCNLMETVILNSYDLSDVLFLTNYSE